MMTPTSIHQRLTPTDQSCLDALEEKLRAKSATFLGYPCNLAFDYTPLFRFLRYSINNVGDPFAPSCYEINTKEFERDVLKYFAFLTHGPTDATWGYVTNGGTEGNLYGAFLARELCPDGIVFYSEDTHYSIHKILRLLNLRGVLVQSQPDGCIDLDDLRRKLEAHVGPVANLLDRQTCRKPAPQGGTPILFANIGTTMKGAVDDVPGMRRVAAEAGFPEAYVHADAALSGMILPFVEDPPAWDFAAGVDSINISGHKMIGSPIPCGVVLTRKEHVGSIGRPIEYVGTLDTTIPGSRNGITPLFLWYALRTVGFDGLRRGVQAGFAIADYLITRLHEHGHAAWRHGHSLTVVIEKPAPSVARKWQLAVHGEIAHVTTMPHVTREQIDRLVEDLVGDEERARKDVPILQRAV